MANDQQQWATTDEHAPAAAVAPAPPPVPGGWASTDVEGGTVAPGSEKAAGRLLYTTPEGIPVYAADNTMQQPAGSAFGRFAENYWANTGGGVLDLAKTLLEGSAATALGQPVPPEVAEALGSIAERHAMQWQKAQKAYQDGHLFEAFGHGLGAILPLLGPAAAAAGEKLGGEPGQLDRYGNVVKPGQAPDIAGGLGAAAGQLTMASIPAIKEGAGNIAGAYDAGRAMSGLPPAQMPTIPMLPTVPKLASTLNPVEQAAVDFLRSKDVHLDAGTITGNRFVKGAQALAQNHPMGARTAAVSRRLTETGLRRVAGELADQVHPEAQTPESAGAAVPREIGQRIEKLGDEETAGYGQAWQGRDNPAYTYDLPVKMEPEYGPDGTFKGMREVKKPVNMPVDVRDVKEKLLPVFEEMQWMPASDRSASAGYTAVKNLLEGDDFIPAWQAERGLSGIKAMARTTNKSGVRNMSQGIGASIISDLQDGIDAAVAHTGDGAIRGLQQGRALHASKMGLADLVEKLRVEPVQAFKQLTWENDTGVDFLRKVAKEAPAQMPQLARALVQKLFDEAMEEGGFAKARTLLSRWEKVGPQTKAILIKDPAVRANLDKFFKAAELVSQNPNPSGTAVVGQLVPGGMLLVTNPVSGGAWLLGGYATAKLLFSPRGVALLTRGLRPQAAAAGAAAAENLLRLAGDRGVEPVPPALLSAMDLGGPRQAEPGAASAANSGTQAVPFARRSPAAGDKFPLGVIDDAAEGNAGIAGEGPPDNSPSGAGKRARPAEAETEIRVPGSPTRYKAVYEVRELDNVQPSHSGHTFQPNNRYQLKNDRDYARGENQGKIINWSGPEFDPSYHITDNPDASNGPPVIDEVGNVYGGNGRTMILQRVYEGNPQGAAAYRQMLAKKAGQFGVDPAQIQGMKKPVLVRVIPDQELATGGASKQQLVTDFNKTGTAALRGSEKAIADSRRVSVDTLDNIGARLEEKGTDATLAEILSGKDGPEVLKRLIDDGVISPQESAAYVDDGVLTADGKQRISKLMLGRFFRDPAQLDITPASIRNKLERIAAPLVKVEGKAGWSLAKPLQEAIDLIEEGRARGQKNLDDVVAQSGLFGSQKYTPEAVRLAKILRDANPNELTKAVRQYAADAAEAEQGPGLFGNPPSPQEAFDAAFSALLKKLGAKE